MSDSDSLTLQPQAAELAGGKPWGFWATVGFSVLIAFVWLVEQLVVTLLYPSSSSMSSHELLEDGTFVALMGLATGIVVPTACVCCVKLKRGITVRDYLGLRGVPLRQLIRWLVVALLLEVVFNITSLFNQPEPFLENAYNSAAFKPLFWIVAVAARPSPKNSFSGDSCLSDCRSRGWETSAPLRTSALWAALHIQYHMSTVAVILVYGLVLGYARLRTDSLVVPLAMHALTNFVAMLETAILSRP